MTAAPTHQVPLWGEWGTGTESHEGQRRGERALTSAFDKGLARPHGVGADRLVADVGGGGRVVAHVDHRQPRLRGQPCAARP